jgi:cell division transport system ATP-binding protein
VELLQGIAREGAAVVMTTHNHQLLEEYPGTVYRFSDHRILRVTEPEAEADDDEIKEVEK